MLNTDTRQANWRRASRTRVSQISLMRRSSGAYPVRRDL